MTEEEVYGQAVELVSQAARLTDADRWWVIEQVAELCRSHPWLAPALVEGFEEWVTEEQAEESDWFPVADVLADLSTRWPEPHLALVWCRLAWEREGEVLRCVEEADRLARLDGADEELLSLGRLEEELEVGLRVGRVQLVDRHEDRERGRQGRGPGHDLAGLDGAQHHVGAHLA